MGVTRREGGLGASREGLGERRGETPRAIAGGSGGRGGDWEVQDDRQGPWRMGGGGEWDAQGLAKVIGGRRRGPGGRRRERGNREGTRRTGEGTGTPGAIGRGMGGQGGIGRPGRSRGEAEDRRGHSVATGNCEEDGGGDWER